MFPVLFRLKIPAWLRDILSFLPEEITIYSYGFFIMIGALLAFFYVVKQSKKQLNIERELVSQLFLYLLIAAYAGGRFLFFFEKPDYYFSQPSRMLQISGSGFVLYGSLLFAIPIMLLFFRSKKIATFPMLDIMAIGGTLVQGFGKLGCLMAGCCHGEVCSPKIGIVYTNPLSRAEPLNMPLYPTQVFDMIILFGAMFFLLWLRKRKQFHGQLFLLYVSIYSVGRAITEIFRGDEERGFVIENLVTHSQFIAFFVLLFCAYFYKRLSKTQRIIPVLERK